MLPTESLQPDLSITPHLLLLCLVPPSTLLQCFSSLLISIYHWTVSPDATCTATAPNEWHQHLPSCMTRLNPQQMTAKWKLYHTRALRTFLHVSFKSFQIFRLVPLWKELVRTHKGGLMIKMVGVCTGLRCTVILNQSHVNVSRSRRFYRHYQSKGTLQVRLFPAL